MNSTLGLLVARAVRACAAASSAVSVRVSSSPLALASRAAATRRISSFAPSGEASAPARILDRARLALAEHQENILAGRIVELERGDDPVAGRLAHDPRRRDGLFAHVEVAARIEDVEEAAHPLHVVDRPRVDLDHPAVADEDHDRELGVGGEAQRGLEARRGDGVRAIAAAEPERLRARDVEAPEQDEELVGVGHRVPRRAQAGDVDPLVAELGLRRGQRLDRRRRLLRPVQLDEGLVGLELALVLEVDLVNRDAVRVEDLDAPPHAGGRGLLDGEGLPPAAQEEAQIDLLADDLPHRALDLDALERTPALEHRRPVAGHRLHGAERDQPLDELLVARVERHDAFTAAARHDLGLAHPERRGHVTRVGVGILCPVTCDALPQILDHSSLPPDGTAPSAPQARAGNATARERCLIAAARPQSRSDRRPSLSCRRGWRSTRGSPACRALHRRRERRTCPGEARACWWPDRSRTSR